MRRRRSRSWWLDADPATEPIWLSALILVAAFALLAVVWRVFLMLSLLTGGIT